MHVTRALIGELQVRLLSALCSGVVQLPSHTTLLWQIAIDRARELRQYGRRAQRISALVDYVEYTNELAKILGCHPGSLLTWVVSDPRLAVAMVLAAHTTTQFRLVGPGAQAELARQTLLSYPLRFPRLMMIAMVLYVIYFIIGLLPFRWAQKYRPAGLYSTTKGCDVQAGLNDFNEEEIRQIQQAVQRQASTCKCSATPLHVGGLVRARRRIRRLGRLLLCGGRWGGRNGSR